MCYGDRDSTIAKIVRKCLRTAMYIYGYLDTREAEIIFASTKLNKAIPEGVSPCLADAQRILDDLGFHFRLRTIANEDFRDKVLKPILLASDGEADTNELFLRSYQMLQMFETNRQHQERIPVSSSTGSKKILGTDFSVEKNEAMGDAYAELKIGKLAQTVLKGLLETGVASEEEVKQMQTTAHSKGDLWHPISAFVRQNR